MLIVRFGASPDRTDLGEEGIELATVNTYDLILLDLNLPDLSGYEVLRALRVARVNTPVVILSGLGATADKVRGLELAQLSQLAASEGQNACVFKDGGQKVFTTERGRERGRRAVGR